MNTSRTGLEPLSAGTGRRLSTGAAALCLFLLLLWPKAAWCAPGGTMGPLRRMQKLDKMLAAAGITMHLAYTGEIKHGSGLVSDHATEYRGLVEFSLDLDTAKLGLWRGGRLFLAGQNGHGNQVEIAPGGNLLPISDIDARNFTQVSQYGLDQALMEGDLHVLAGKQDTNTYFCVNDFGGQFLFPSYTLIPTVPLPTFPAPALGLTVLAHPAEPVHLNAGIYDGAPQIGSSGWNSLLDGRGGYFMILEPGVTPAFGRGGAYGGHYRVGFWYHTGTAPDIRSAESESDNYGLYLVANQWVYKERDAEDQGLGLIFQLGWAPADRNAVNRYIGGGFAYTGLLPARDQDTLGFCVSYAGLTGQPRAPENVDLVHAELYYSIQISPLLNLQPDVQYFSNPGTDHEDGWAANLRWVVSF